MKKKTFLNVLVSLLLIAGIGIMSYPFLSQWFNKRNHTVIIQQYQETVNQLQQEKIALEFHRAQAYNQQLPGTFLQDPFAAIPTEINEAEYEYLSIFQVNGMMGYIEIPVIQVYLPIYHTTQETVLKKGVGHLQASALPTGQPGGHPIFTAHRGLPSSRLFTDLDQIKIGDQIYIHVLDQAMAYEVDQILTVTPDNTQALQPVWDQDYITLVTCTPLAVNSHRLLVRGVRTPENNLLTPPPQNIGGKNLLPLYVAVFLVILSIPAVILFRKKK